MWCPNALQESGARPSSQCLNYQVRDPDLSHSHCSPYFEAMPPRVTIDSNTDLRECQLYAFHKASLRQRVCLFGSMKECPSTNLFTDVYEWTALTGQRSSSVVPIKTSTLLLYWSVFDRFRNTHRTLLSWLIHRSPSSAVQTKRVL